MSSSPPSSNDNETPTIEQNIAYVRQLIMELKRKNNEGPETGNPVVAQSLAWVLRQHDELRQKIDEQSRELITLRVKDYKSSAKDQSTKALGRLFFRLVDLFGDVRSVVNHLEDYHDGKFGPPSFIEERSDFIRGKSISRRTESEDTELAHYRDLERGNIAAGILYKQIDKFEQKIAGMEPEEINDYYSTLMAGAASARADDLVKVSQLLPSLINQHRQLQNIYVKEFGDRPPPLDPRTRIDCGVGNLATLFLLTPIEHNTSDTTVVKGIRDGVLSLSSSYFLRIFYKNFIGDISDVAKNYLQSSILLVCVQLILTSASSLETDFDSIDFDEPTRTQKRKRSAQATKKTNATIMHMGGKVTARIIAYTACLLHYSLTDAGNWTQKTPKYYNVDYRCLYEFIIDFIEDVHTEEEIARSQALLAWYDSHIFPYNADQVRTNAANINSRKRLAVQAERRAEGRAQAQGRGASPPV